MPLTIDPISVLERLDVHELPFDGVFGYPEQLDPQRLQQSAHCRRPRIPGPAEFAISLIADVDATAEKCPFCGCEDGEWTSGDDENIN
jgi:hypothetical protein